MAISARKGEPGSPFVIGIPFGVTVPECDRAETWTSRDESAGSDAAMVLPLGLADGLTGLLVVTARSADYFTSERIALAENVIPEVTLAVRNILLVDELRRRHSDLSDAYNALVRNAHIINAGALGAAFTHEARNPLNNMLARLDVIEDRTPPAATTTDLYMIRQNCQRIQESLNRLLSHWVDVPPKLQPVSMLLVVDAAGSLMSGQLKSYGVQLALEFSSDSAQVEVDADATRLQAAFEHMFANAMEAGSKRITVRAEIVGSEIRVLVQDDGCGMRPEQIRQLFEPFKTFKPRRSGLGGFAIMHSIRTINGSVRVLHSSPGGGTTLEIVLPRRDPVR